MLAHLTKHTFMCIDTHWCLYGSQLLRFLVPLCFNVIRAENMVYILEAIWLATCCQDKNRGSYKYCLPPLFWLLERLDVTHTVQ